MATSTASSAVPLSIEKRWLYGPGPSEVDKRTLTAMQLPPLGIRDPQFLRIASEIQDGLQSAFGTVNSWTFPLPASGSGGMEAAVANFVEPGSRFGVFVAGHFSERIAAMALRQGATVLRCEKNWGEVFSEQDARDFIERERPEIIAFVQGETSTGAFQSGASIIPAAREAGSLVLADAVTTLGAMPVGADALDIDVAFSCSQKGLSCAAGLAPITVSQRAAERLQRRTRPSPTWYFDLALVRAYFEAPHVYHHTPSPPLYYALRESLAAIAEEGLEARWERHRRAGAQLMEGLRGLGFTPLVESDNDRLWHLAVVFPPPGVDEAQLRARLTQRHGIEIAGGLGQLTGQVLRIGTMGLLAGDEPVARLLRAIADSL